MVRAGGNGSGYHWPSVRPSRRSSLHSPNHRSPLCPPVPVTFWWTSLNSPSYLTPFSVRWCWTTPLGPAWHCGRLLYKEVRTPPPPGGQGQGQGKDQGSGQAGGQGIFDPQGITHPGVTYFELFKHCLFFSWSVGGRCCGRPSPNRNEISHVFGCGRPLPIQARKFWISVSPLDGTSPHLPPLPITKYLCVCKAWPGDYGVGVTWKVLLGCWPRVFPPC